MERKWYKFYVPKLIVLVYGNPTCVRNTRRRLPLFASPWTEATDCCGHGSTIYITEVYSPISYRRDIDDVVHITAYGDMQPSSTICGAGAMFCVERVSCMRWCRQLAQVSTKGKKVSNNMIKDYKLLGLNGRRQLYSGHIYSLHTS